MTGQAELTAAHPLDPGSVFNGNFSFSCELLTSAAGWRGHSAGDFEPGAISGGCLHLSPTGPYRTHNRLYVPPKAGVLSFELRIDKESADGDYLNVLFEGVDGSAGIWPAGIAGLLELSVPTADFVPVWVLVPPEDRGRVGTIRFAIVGVDGCDAEVSIDGVEFIAVP